VYVSSFISLYCLQKQEKTQEDDIYCKGMLIYVYVIFLYLRIVTE